MDMGRLEFGNRAISDAVAAAKRTANAQEEMVRSQKEFREHFMPASLRDQFAMAALAGLLADPSSGGPETTARAAYKYADAMLAERMEEE